MRISEILGLIEGNEGNTGGQTKEASVTSGGNEDNLVATLDNLLDRAFGSTTKTAATKDEAPPEVVAPDQMVENTEDELTDEDVAEIAAAAQGMAESAGGAVQAAKEAIKQNITQAGVAVVEDAISELSGEQQTKIASIVNEHFKDSPAKAKLFAKLAAKKLASSPRIVTDMDFAQYQTNKGDKKDREAGSVQSGEKVNEIKNNEA